MENGDRRCRTAEFIAEQVDFREVGTLQGIGVAGREAEVCRIEAVADPRGTVGESIEAVAYRQHSGRVQRHDAVDRRGIHFAEQQVWSVAAAAGEGSERIPTWFFALV